MKVEKNVDRTFQTQQKSQVKFGLSLRRRLGMGHGQSTQPHEGQRPAQLPPLPCKKGRGPRPKGCCDIGGGLEGFHGDPPAMPTNPQLCAATSFLRDFGQVSQISFF